MTQPNENKIIHVMADEKFNDMAIRQFEEEARGVNEFWIVAKELILTKSPLARKCTLDELLQQLSRSNVAGVIFHGLLPTYYRLLRHIPDDKCVVWLGWGYDYYSLLKHENEDSRILPKSKYLQSPPFKNCAKRILNPFLDKLRLIKNRASVSDLKRIDYFSPVLDIEYAMVLRHVQLRAKYITWNYGTAEDDLSLPDMSYTTGTNILVGNSATATNNHVEIFEAIRRNVDLTNRKVIVPLSYGDLYYRSKVIEQGERILGEAFSPLITFMPKEQYLETVRSCGFVMMNHLRQQALGNICMAMLIGAKVYLNKQNPLTGWLESRGAIMGSTDGFNLEPLQEREKEINRQLIYSHWGRTHQRIKTERLIKAIQNYRKHRDEPIPLN
ncbi:TDP-N-acetylfucosamine:lipid II N-acetylfucosaminyltransferase [Thauera sp. 27]|uniref:TDP-N-acetylfucosamine:lipid II N-acetylfucosaminyltransferase n=1 Tax=Thauera sp. 27 TaxID=305700 RepID=UPI0009F9BABC|nr:TDP-N-acetylfucosamine:lipid II N-acetylfucosaminyltransferase [Thauera sp. 27]